MANKNTNLRNKLRRDRYVAHKRGLGVFPDGLAPFSPNKPGEACEQRNNNPKVGRSAGDIMKHLYGSRGRRS